MITPDMNRLSKLTLVASDQAYLYGAGHTKEVLIGNPLAELPDTPGSGFPLPYAIESGFVVTATEEDPITGFKFAATACT